MKNTKKILLCCICIIVVVASSIFGTLAWLTDQVVLLREDIEKVESQCANVDRFLSIVERYTEIPELTPHILHEFVDKIVVHTATDPHSKTKRRQEVDIYYKGIGILEMSKVYATREK